MGRLVSCKIYSIPGMTPGGQRVKGWDDSLTTIKGFEIPLMLLEHDVAFITWLNGQLQIATGATECRQCGRIFTASQFPPK
jgi:hypothetical protein